MWCINTKECYLAVKNTDIMKFTYKQLELENIFLSEIIHTWKDNHGIYAFLSVHWLLNKG